MFGTILLSIACFFALIAVGLMLRLLLIERGKVRDLTRERDEAKLEQQSLLHTKRHNERTIDSLREELTAARQFAQQVERFSNKRVEEMSGALRGAHALIEMFLVVFEGLEDYIHLDRKEARRLFVV